jgi:hypothetical protein
MNNIAKQKFICARNVWIILFLLHFLLATTREAPSKNVENHNKNIATISFLKSEHAIEIRIDDQRFANYVFEDEDIPRPYFCDLHTPGGIPITRNHPPLEGVDPTDHATYHPGLWMSFGDISGNDYWRNQARTKHIRFEKEPENAAGCAEFGVLNHYPDSDGAIICEERCHYTIVVQPDGYLLIIQSEFSSPIQPFLFGDQEEMGLGVRVATPVSVKSGGTICNSNGQQNESQVWGQPADWCDYSGIIAGVRVGVALLASPRNFRKSWFHARDYGLLVANPFGRNAFTKRENSQIVIEPNQPFRLGFGVFIYCANEDGTPDFNKVYSDFSAMVTIR